MLRDTQRHRDTEEEGEKKREIKKSIEISGRS